MTKQYANSGIELDTLISLFYIVTALYLILIAYSDFTQFLGILLISGMTLGYFAVSLLTLHIFSIYYSLIVSWLEWRQANKERKIGATHTIYSDRYRRCYVIKEWNGKKWKIIKVGNSFEDNLATKLQKYIT